MPSYDVRSYLSDLDARGFFDRLINNPSVQFGPPARPYLGANLLPERTVPLNRFTETGLRFTTVIANDGARYAPVQRKEGGQVVGTFDVSLGEQDIGREFTGRDYDAFLDYLSQGGGSMEQAARLLGQFVDTGITRALVELNEKHRWDAIVNASIVRTGDNGYSETVSYPNPASHRANAGGTWSSDAYDPYTDIIAMSDLLRTKGYNVSRIITSTKVLNIMLGNDKLKDRWSANRTIIGGSVAFRGRMTQAELQGGMQADGLPMIEVYDNTYRTTTSTARFLADTVMVMISTTGRDETIGWASGDRFLPDTLGYTAIGRAVGQPGPGRVLKAFPFDDKPPRIVFEGWQTSLPVLMDPEAIAVITAIA
jgi:hypothetical protein